jgi:radical SAM superfamily enzyme YgiQ (UPF0313 family)
MKKLLLINPAKRTAGLGAYKSTTMPPLALAYIAALTPKDDYEIEIVDENIEKLSYPDADLVGITSYTAHVSRAYEIAKIYKSRNVPVVIGGIHVSMLPDEALEYCDAVVIGEAESIWANVLSDFENGKLSGKYYGDQIELDKLPFPDRGYLKNDRYLWGSILTSRGCPMECSFCSVTQFNGRRFRRRYVNDVINELSDIKNKFILILDDNILGYSDKSWLYKFFTEIIRRGIKKYFYAQVSMQFGEDQELVKLAYKAGLRIVLTGIESINSESLELYNKKLNHKYIKNLKYPELINNIRKNGVAIIGCFMLGSDGDDIRIFHRTLEFIKKWHIDILQITKPTPLPGTKFFNELAKNNRIIDTDFPTAWQNYRFTRLLFKPKNLSIQDVYEGVFYIKKRYYGFFSSIRRFFHTLIDTKSVSSTIVCFLINKSYKSAWLNSEIYTEYDKQQLIAKFESYLQN